jgi:non-ribosomal peptide synthase protein (TIGR01720 family)
VLPPKTTSFKAWAERLQAYARSPEVEAELAYWEAQGGRAVPPLPRDGAGGANTLASSRDVVIALGETDTRELLLEVPGAYRAHIDEILLAALAHAFSRWTGGAVRVELEGHGREELFEDVELSRTVGWFTSLRPVVLECAVGAAPGEALRSVKEALRQVPGRGMGHGLLRYLGTEEVVARMRALPAAEVAFNYLGQMDGMVSAGSPFGVSQAARGPMHGAGGTRSHVLKVNGLVIGGRLELAFTYSENLHARGTIERLAHGFREALEALVAGRASPEASRWVPSDFPLAKLDQPTLDRLLQRDPDMEDL